MGRHKKEVPNHGQYYEIKANVPDKHGNTVRKSFYSLISKDDAREQANKYRINMAIGKVEDKHIGFSDYADHWLEACKENSVSETTYYYTYRNSIENHLKKYFGKYALVNIRLDDVQKFFNSNKQYSNSMLQKLRITLNAIFERAADEGLISRNPCRGLIMPKSSKVAKAKCAYTAEEARKLVDFVKAYQDGYSIVILIKTGMRRGELLALRWVDVDLKNKIINVRQSLKEANGLIIIGPPKTKTSIRQIPIDDETVEILKAVPREVTRYKGKGKNRTSYQVKNEYVVPDSKGQYMRPQNWQRRIYDKMMTEFVVQNPDIKKLNAHELRHTYGTLLYKSGTDILTISKLMGHANVLITTKIYVHDDLETIKASMKYDW